MEDGQAIADRIAALAADVAPAVVAALAIEARQRFKLRHAPLMLLCALARTGSGSSLVAETIERVIQRADELSEFLALYWRNGRRPVTKQMKRGLAAAFAKFDAYQLAKYDRDGPVKLRDVLFLAHAKPKDEAQAALWKQVAERSLPSPDTWEVALSGGSDKRASFERLLAEHKLGYLALLRNLRNMDQAGVDEDLVKDAILARRGAERVLPFRYVAAARAAPRFEPWVDQALTEAVLKGAVFEGRTIVLVSDVSGSMNWRLVGEVRTSPGWMRPRRWPRSCPAKCACSPSRRKSWRFRPGEAWPASTRSFVRNHTPTPCSVRLWSGSTRCRTIG